MPWKEVNDWFGNNGIVVDTLDEYAEAVENVFGFRPVIRDDGTIRAYYKRREEGGAPEIVFDGEPEFDQDEWLASPNLVSLLEPVEDKE